MHCELLLIFLAPIMAILVSCKPLMRLVQDNYSYSRLILGRRRPLIAGSELHTVYIKNSIRFSYFGEKYHRNNLPNGICRYDFDDNTTRLCNIFRLGEWVHIIINITIPSNVQLRYYRLHLSSFYYILCEYLFHLPPQNQLWSWTSIFVYFSFSDDRDM